MVSLDWKWLFIYPEQRVASVNELVVPANRAGALLADVGVGDEHVLRAAARQHDLHDERHGHAALAAGRPAGAIYYGTSGHSQRRRLLGHAVHRPCRVARRLRALGQHQARDADTRSTKRGLRRCWPGRASTTSRSTTYGAVDHRTSSIAIVAQQAAAGAGSRSPNARTVPKENPARKAH